MKKLILVLMVTATVQSQGIPDNFMIRVKGVYTLWRDAVTMGFSPVYIATFDGTDKNGKWADWYNKVNCETVVRSFRKKIEGVDFWCEVGVARGIHK